jgi:hypothetical protein
VKSDKRVSELAKPKSKWKSRKARKNRVKYRTERCEIALLRFRTWMIRNAGYFRIPKNLSNALNGITGSSVASLAMGFTFTLGAGATFASKVAVAGRSTIVRLLLPGHLQRLKWAVLLPLC